MGRPLWYPPDEPDHAIQGRLERLEKQSAISRSTIRRASRGPSHTSSSSRRHVPRFALAWERSSQDGLHPRPSDRRHINRINLATLSEQLSSDIMRHIRAAEAHDRTPRRTDVADNDATSPNRSDSRQFNHDSSLRFLESLDRRDRQHQDAAVNRVLARFRVPPTDRLPPISSFDQPTFDTFPISHERDMRHRHDISRETPQHSRVTHRTPAGSHRHPRRRISSPESWNTLLDTITPDPQPPSQNSSFTSTIASDAEGSSRTAATSFSSVERDFYSALLDAPCDDENTYERSTDEDSVDRRAWLQR